MLRLLAILALAILIWLLLDWLFRQVMGALGIAPSRRSSGGARQTSGGAASAGRSEELVRCPACGTYVPASRALPLGRAGSVLACSEECRQRLRAGAGPS